jgi:hypothetical protein
MVYIPPSGWVEVRPTGESEPVAAKFHARRDCSRIQDGAVRAVDKPYSAARCPLCAGEAGPAGIITEPRRAAAMTA